MRRGRGWGWPHPLPLLLIFRIRSQSRSLHALCLETFASQTSLKTLTKFNASETQNAFNFAVDDCVFVNNLSAPRSAVEGAMYAIGLV